MERYLFMRFISDSLEKSDFVKKIFSIYLKAIAVFTILAGLVGFVIGWRDVLKMSTSGLIGGIIFQTLFIIAIYSVVHSFFIGAEKINELKENKSIFTHISFVLARSLAMAYAGFAIVMAVAGGIFIWFAGTGVRNANSLFRVINHYYPFTGLKGEVFIQGLTFMIRGVAYAFLISLALYVIAELLIAIVRSKEG